MTKKIAVLNNSTGIVEILKNLFVEEGIKTYIVKDFAELVYTIKAEDINLLLIDLELDRTGMGRGIELIRCIRKETSIPIIIVSAQTSETAKIVALNVGADDYVTTEDSSLVILARIKAQLRRYTELTTLCASLHHIYRVGDLEIDDSRHTVLVQGKEVKLTPIEYKILRLLIQERGKVLSIDQIYERIWQLSPVEADNVVAVHIRHIREKIERNPKEPCYLKVVWGMGYKVG